MEPFLYRECRATITARIPDTPDADQHPDRVLVQGRGTAHPQFQGGSVVFTEIGEYAIPQPIPVVIQDGELLVEVLAGDETVTTQPLFLPVTVDERANQNWSWRLVFDFLTLGEYGEEVKHPPLSFPVEAGDGPLEISTVATPVIKSQGFVTRGAPGPGLQEITAEDGELVFHWDNGNTAVVPVPDAVPGPPGPMVDVTAGTVEVGATPTDFGVSVTGDGETRQINVMLPKPEKGDTGSPGADGEGATDPEMAARIANPATQTRATLDSAFVGSDSVRRIITTDDPNYIGGPGELVFITPPPPTFFTDFTGTTVGQQPEGTTRHFLMTRTWLVQSTAFGSGGRSLVATGGGANGGLAFDVFSRMAVDEVEYELAFQWRKVSRDNGTIRAADSIHEYVPDERFGITAGARTQATQDVRKWVGGIESVAIDDASVPFTWDPDTDYITVYRRVGVYVYVKTWAKSTAEPEQWHVTVLDTLTPAGGWIGLHSWNGNTTYIDWVGFAVGPRTAPRG